MDVAHNVLSVLISNHPTCLRQCGVSSISVRDVPLVLCYNHSNSINSSLLHLPKTWTVSNSFTTIRGSALQANMSRLGCKEKRMLSCPDVISSNGTWNLGVKYCLAVWYRTSFFIMRWEMCVRLRTGPERFGKELGLSTSKRYKPWSLHPPELGVGFSGRNFFQITETFHR